MSTLQGESFYFHHGWHFLRADAFPMAKAVDAHRDAEGHAFYEADYRETGWQPVTLPHTFNDEDLFRDRIQDGGSGQRRTAAFYRNILTIPARHKNHKVLLAFEGLRQTCYLYVNGTLAGYYEAGVAPFGFDITPYVRYDAPNLIAIATDNTATRNAPFCIAETPNKPDAVPGSYLFPQEQAVPADRVGVPFFWNCNDFNPSVGGITRPVQVFFKPDVYLTLPLYSNLQTKGLYVYGRNFDLDNATADIRVEAEIRNEGKVPVSAQLRITLRRPDGSVAAIFDGAPATAAPTGRAVPPLSITPADAYIPDEAVPGHYRPVEDESLPAPTATDSMAVTVLHAGAATLPLRFWSIDDPYLYTVEAELFVNGEKTDAQQLTTGFRAVSYDKDRGLRINGTVQWLRGYAQRAANEWAAIGIAPEWLHDEDRLVAFIGGAQIDPYGNVNSTCIFGKGDYLQPTTRFTGSGGANGIATYCNTIIMMQHQKRRFMDHVDYITSCGWMDGPGGRERAGLPGNRGPQMVVTDLGIMKFDEETKRMYLAYYYPFSSPEMVQENTGFEIDVSRAELMEGPSPEIIRLIREEIDPGQAFIKVPKDK